ncbi:NRDE family protein [Desulfonema magnum]|uniref:Transport and Golgi organization protein n=1 Tax=Desulfonema magnum TaxID=45655 RepID=A0A975GRK6_9BACT|nr:NRDE family protein [Desulfonema magnum]QTA91151.1 Transport and Golgi organization protein [Desulfonema magnum]
MCLIFFSYNQHTDYRLILAANRDEYYERPTQALDFWDDTPHILAGRDLRGNGTWMGITRTGRWAAITNFRDPASLKADAPSRGMLVSNFLIGEASPEAYLEHISSIGHRYNGFNLLVGDASTLCYYSNRGNGIQKMNPGLYGLSNHLIDTPWPKVKKGKADLEIPLARKEIDFKDIFQILENKDHPPDETLPDTGVGLTWERILSPLFVTSDIYGTRSSSVLLMEKTGKISFWERTFIPNHHGDADAGETRKFSFVVV